jgi:uncharacterized protein YciI
VYPPLLILVFGSSVISTHESTAFRKLTGAAAGQRGPASEDDMKTFVVRFSDNDDHADQRTRFMVEHLDFLERNQERILAAGPLRSINGEPSGGLWVVSAEDGAAVQQLVEEDPFWLTGLRKSVEILEWRRVFADGKRTDRPA